LIPGVNDYLRQATHFMYLHAYTDIFLPSTKRIVLYKNLQNFWTFGRGKIKRIVFKVKNNEGNVLMYKSEIRLPPLPCPPTL